MTQVTKLTKSYELHLIKNKLSITVTVTAQMSQFVLDFDRLIFFTRILVTHKSKRCPSFDWIKL